MTAAGQSRTDNPESPVDVPYRKKLIEVALQLKAINEASAREKSIRHGHPVTMHNALYEHASLLARFQCQH
jgi:hypothetical protein